MPLELQPATAADAHRSAEIESAAYASNPFNPILFPGPFPPEALAYRADQLAAELRDDPTTRWFKVVDTELPEPKQMIAFSKWHVYEETPRLKPRSFGPGCNGEACELVFGGIAEKRVRIVGDKPYVFFALLHTDPKHQHRGAASMLIKRSMEDARQLGFIVYLESSKAGYSLYQKHGFRDVERLSVDLSKWGAADKHETWSMIWDPAEGVA